MHVHPTAARLCAWGGAVLFAAALGQFLFTYAVTFAESPTSRVDPRAIGIDVALFGLFAAHHSVFARTRVRLFVARLVPAHLERSLYVWVASLMLIGVCLLWQPIGGIAWTLTGAWRWVASAGQLAGLLLTIRSAAAIDVWELAGVRPAAPRTAGSAPARPQEFTSTGPYGLVRHPIYLGWILVVFGVWTMTMDRLVFAAASTLYILAAIPLEEKTLREGSGGAYDDYMRRIRWKLIPGVY